MQGSFRKRTFEEVADALPLRSELSHPQDTVHHLKHPVSASYVIRPDSNQKIPRALSCKAMRIVRSAITLARASTACLDRLRTLCGIVLLAALCWAQDPLLQGNLNPGPHLVGFQSFISLDESRRYDGKARPILFDIWYPASDAETATLHYERYLQVPDVKIHPWFRKRLQDFIRSVVIDDLFHKRERSLNNDERSAFKRLLSTPTGAHLNAPPVPGPFPVVLYHSGAGGSFEDNSVLFEYLASHGYVVVSSAFESPFPKFVANNMGGIERSGPDLDFMAQKSP